MKFVVISLKLQQPQRKQFAQNSDWGSHMSLFWSSQGSGKQNLCVIGALPEDLNNLYDVKCVKN